MTKLNYYYAAVAERPIAAALRAVWSRTGPHGFKSHPPRFYPMPNGTDSSTARISGHHPLYRGSIPLSPLIQHNLLRVRRHRHYIDIKILLEQVLVYSLQPFRIGYMVNESCYNSNNNYFSKTHFEQKDYETALQIIREILMIIQRGYFLDGTKQMARCVDCTYRNICV